MPTTFVNDSQINEINNLMLNIMPMRSICWNKNYQPITCNESAVKFHGFTTTNEYLEKFYQLSPQYQPDGRKSESAAKQWIQKAFDDGFARFNWLHKSPDGGDIPSEITLIRTKLTTGEPVIAGYARDLSDSLEVKAEIRETYTRARLMLDATPLCANFWDRNFNNIDCNLEALKLFGLKSKQEYLDRFLELSPEYQPCGTPSVILTRQKIETAFKEGSCKFEWIHQTLDGEPIPAEITLTRVKYKNDHIVISYTRDLREIKASLIAMREADERTHIMLDATPLCCSLIDRNGNIIDCNQEAANLFDLPSKQEYIKHFANLEDEYQPNGQHSRIQVLEYINKAFHDGYYRFEWMHRKLNGEYIPAEITLVRVKYHDQDILACYARDLRELKAMLKEMHKVENDLRVARDAAEESTRAKSEFLANMSHEIRTPMNGILGLLHLVLKTNLNHKQLNYLKKMEISAQTLLRIINDILDFSKIEAGKLELENHKFDLYNIVNELKCIFESDIKNKGLDFNVKIKNAMPQTLIGDSLRLKQVLINLIGNALKFTQQGGITLNIERANTSKNHCFLKFTVTDTGIGMTPDQVKNLFGAFSQGDASITRRYGGTGLGLAISKNLVNMMEGEIWAESQHMSGSVFCFTAQFKLPPQNNFRLEDMMAGPIIVNMPHEENKAAVAYQFTPAHILLVEDNEINQLIACELAQNAGYTVDIANNGQEALQKLAANKYDLILMDIQMPIMDGLTTTLNIRKHNKYATLPIIAMSAHAMSGDREKSLKAGMNDHLTKPINPKSFYAALAKWLKTEEMAA